MGRTSPRVVDRRPTDDGGVALRYTELPTDAEPTLVGVSREDLVTSSDACSVASFGVMLVAVVCGAFAVSHWPGEPSASAGWSYAGLGLMGVTLWLLRRRRAYLVRLAQSKLDERDGDASQSMRRESHRAMRLEERVAELESLAKRAKTEPSLLRPPGVTAGGGTQGPDGECDEEDEGPPRVHD